MLRPVYRKSFFLVNYSAGLCWYVEPMLSFHSILQMHVEVNRPLLVPSLSAS